VSVAAQGGRVLESAGKVDKGEDKVKNDEMVKTIRRLEAKDAARSLLLAESRLAPETKEAIVSEIGQIAEASPEADIKVLTEAVSKRYISAVEKAGKMNVQRSRPLIEMGGMTARSPGDSDNEKELTHQLGESLFGRSARQK
jgi:hypothetical protein